MMSDKEKVLQVMKYLHMSSVYQENEYKQARENVMKASPFDVQAHLDYFKACCIWEEYNRLYRDLALLIFNI